MRLPKLFGLLLFSATLGAQGSEGTEFWFAFPCNNVDNAPTARSVFITSGGPASGTLSIPGLGYSAPFSVAAGAVTTLQLPAGSSACGSIVLPAGNQEGIENMGVHVVSDQPVSVYGLDRIVATTDAFLALPVPALGTEYRVASYGGYRGSEFTVVATEDGTQVTVTLSHGVPPRAAGVPYSVTLNRGQTYTLMDMVLGDAEDLSGTLISSDRPVAVLGGHRCTIVPMGYSACDHLVEQLPPTSAWGRRFVTVPLATRLNGDIFRVVADHDNTVVTVNGVAAGSLAAGACLHLTLTASSLIETSEPALVMQYSASSSFDGITSDPFMMLVPPDEQFSDHYVVSAPASGFSLNFVNVAIHQAQLGAVTLDGAGVPAGSFSPIPGTDYYSAALPVAPGGHSLASSGPFGVWVYGFDLYDSYGYPGGNQTSAVALVDSLTLGPKAAVRTVGEEHCVTATALSAGAPVAGVRIDFVRTGAHPGTGFGYTDASGQASWCWTGAVAGGDDIRAGLSDLSDSAHADWQIWTPTPTASPSPTRTVTPSPTISPTFTVSPTPTATVPPLTLTLLPANPDPAQDRVWLPYVVRTDAEVDIQVWDVAGETVRRWNEGFMGLGAHEAPWDLRNEAGIKVASGIYIYRIRARSPAGEEESDYRKCAVAR